MSRPRARTIDVAASALAHLLPRPLARAVDQARLDAASLVDGLSGRRAPAFSTRESPLARPRALDEIDPIAEILPDPIARRYEVVARDVRTITRELRGDRLPAVVPRTTRLAKTRHSQPPPAHARRSLVVTALARETDDALAITLADVGGRALSFTPGQFLTLHLVIDGRELRRAYSISSTAADGPRVTIVVKRIDGGLASEHLHRALSEGDLLDVSGPSGSFVAPPATAPRHLVFFAGGSGITPIASILRTALEREPGARITLVYGNRAERDVIFRERLDVLAAAHADRLRIVHVLEEPSPLAAHVGRPDAGTVRALVNELGLDARLPGEDPALHFVCGPAPMMAGVRRALADAGVPDARIREERFLSPADRTAPRIGLPATPQAITIRRRGVLRTFEQRPSETILEAATRQGHALPSSCTMGGCGACRCRASEGEVAVDEPSCLTEAERAEGWVLTCVGRARGPVTLEVP